MTYVTLFVAMAMAMLVRDACYSVTTWGISHGKWPLAASANAMGDGVGLVGVMLAVNFSMSDAFTGQAISFMADMLGAFVGVLVAHYVSDRLDGSFGWYHKNPSGLINSTPVVPVAGYAENGEPKGPAVVLSAKVVQ